MWRHWQLETGCNLRERLLNLTWTKLLMSGLPILSKWLKRPFLKFANLRVASHPVYMQLKCCLYFRPRASGIPHEGDGCRSTSHAGKLRQTGWSESWKPPRSKLLHIITLSGKNRWNTLGEGLFGYQHYLVKWTTWRISIKKTTDCTMSVLVAALFSPCLSEPLNGWNFKTETGIHDVSFILQNVFDSFLKYFAHIILVYFSRKIFW